MQRANRLAFVTGAASGISRAIVRNLVADGCRVLAFDRNADGLKTLANELGTGVITRTVDVAEWSGVEKLVSSLATLYGPPDYLVCGAGINPLVGGTDMVDEKFYDDVMAVNLKGTYVFCRSVLPLMAKKRAGSVVNIASVSGLIGWGGSSVYSASKGGIIALTRSLATEFAGSGIRVNCVCPGSVRTPMVLDNLQIRNDLEEGMKRIATRHPVGRIGEAEEIAEAVGFLLGEASSFITGVALAVDGGLTAV